MAALARETGPIQNDHAATDAGPGKLPLCLCVKIPPKQPQICYFFAPKYAIVDKDVILPRVTACDPAKNVTFLCKDAEGICYKWTRISQNFWKLVSNMLKMERNIAIFGLSNMLFSHRHKGNFPGPTDAEFELPD
jgi:hypothetical protein